MNLRNLNLHLAPWLPVITLIIIWLIFFSRTLSGQFFYYLDDLKIIYHPLETEYAAAQNNGQLPLWSNYFGFGHPLASWGQLGYFTPLHLLLRAISIPPLILLQISILSYWLLGLLGMYWYLRARTFKAWPAVLGAVIFAINGFTIGHLNHVNFYTSVMVLPYLLLALHYLIKAPNLPGIIYTGLAAAVVAGSGQPQIALYTLIIAAIITAAMAINEIIAAPHKQTYILKIAGSLLLSGAIALSLASPAILPLLEFIPETERAAGLPAEELFEFSYPPYHAITLILPYFFGDHASYWGPKGFQELAAFVGIIPLMAAGAALTALRRPKYRAEIIAGIVLITIACLFATARYSPLYTYLVDTHVITSLSVPGRFVYFFVIGITLLAPLGMQEKSRRLTPLLAILLPGILIAIPFQIALNTNGRIDDQLQSILAKQNPFIYLIVASVLTYIVYLILPRSLKAYRPYAQMILVAICSGTLMVYAWNYNPLTARTPALTDPLFSAQLRQYEADQGTPARLYSSERIEYAGRTEASIKKTEGISPAFYVVQPITLEAEQSPCFTITIYARGQDSETLTISLHDTINNPALTSLDISTKTIATEPSQNICFSNFIAPKPATYFLSFTSEMSTNIRLQAEEEYNTDQQAYFFRVKEPDGEQISKSRKTVRIPLEAAQSRRTDFDKQLLARHINVLASASSANWIGALSVRPYREFIDSFFGNDGEVVDGDGQHALARHRDLFNMTGVTHLAQSVPYKQATDPLQSHDFALIEQHDTGQEYIRLYHNPAAYPKAYMVDSGTFLPAADEGRYYMKQPGFNPRTEAVISGPVPPQPLEATTLPHEYSAQIRSYNPTNIVVEVSTNKPAYLIVTDSTTPNWRSYIDGQAAPYLVANTIFKAVQIPSGNHTVEFKYASPAVNLSLKLFTAGIAAIGVLTLLYFIKWPQTPKSR